MTPFHTVHFPSKPPTLQEALLWTAHLGGFLARKSAHQPGLITIWRGLRALSEKPELWRLARPPDDVGNGEPRFGEGTGEGSLLGTLQRPTMSARNIVIGQKVDPAKVQQAKELRRHMTKEERILWQRLRGNRLRGLHFRRQQIIDGCIVDFYCHAAGLVVEVDGEVHQQQAAYDAERDRILSARGLRIVRVRNEEVRQDLSGVLSRIGAVCREGT